MPIRNLYVIAAAALSLSACATMSGDSATAGPIVGPIREGRCHMNGCSWFQVQSFDIVRETERGALLRVVSREGSSMHPDGNYPRRLRESAINWTDSETSYFFCSTRYPAILSQTENGFEGYRLDLTMIAGATEFVHNEYRAICHPDGDFDGSPEGARRLGYTSFDGPAEFIVARPEELFDRAG